MTSNKSFSSGLFAICLLYNPHLLDFTDVYVPHSKHLSSVILSELLNFDLKNCNKKTRSAMTAKMATGSDYIREASDVVRSHLIGQNFRNLSIFMRYTSAFSRWAPQPNRLITTAFQQGSVRDVGISGRCEGRWIYMAIEIYRSNI